MRLRSPSILLSLSAPLLLAASLSLAADTISLRTRWSADAPQKIRLTQDLHYGASSNTLADARSGQTQTLDILLKPLPLDGADAPQRLLHRVDSARIVFDVAGMGQAIADSAQAMDPAAASPAPPPPGADAAPAQPATAKAQIQDDGDVKPAPAATNPPAAPAAPATTATPAPSGFQSTVGPHLRRIIDMIKATPITLTLEEQGKIGRIEGFYDQLDQLRMQEPQFVMMFEQFFSPASIRASLEQSLRLIPQRDVAIGDAWSGQIVFNLSSLGLVAAEARSTLIDTQVEGGRTLAHIRTRFTLLTRDDFLSDPRFEKLKVVEALPLANIEGETFFDPQSGQIVRSRITLDLPIATTIPSDADEHTMQTLKVTGRWMWEQQRD